jgi:hypothetical protein
LIASIVEFDTSFLLNLLLEQLDEGNVAGHRILNLETSRKIAAAAAASGARSSPRTSVGAREHKKMEVTL